MGQIVVHSSGVVVVVVVVDVVDVVDVVVVAAIVEGVTGVHVVHHVGDGVGVVHDGDAVTGVVISIQSCTQDMMGAVSMLLVSV